MNATEENKTLTDRLVRSIPTLAILLFLLGAGLVGRVFYVVSLLDSSTVSGTEESRVLQATYNLAQKQLAVRSLQIAAGYGVGFFCVASGVILAWCGVSGQVEFKAADGPRNVSFQTGSVGAAIVLFGVVLIGISMFCRPIKVNNADGIKFESPFSSGDRTTVGEI